MAVSFGHDPVEPFCGKLAESLKREEISTHWMILRSSALVTEPIDWGVMKMN
jgi:hypothetical protein